MSRKEILQYTFDLLQKDMIMNKLRVCVIGCGDFAQCFVPLFKAHPYVEKVFVCDKIAERAKSYSEKFGVDIIDSFEEAISRDDIDSIALFVERHLHGPFVCAALKAGKHVYSAVPMASNVEECREIVELVKKTGLIYMMGETCIYYPCSMYCKREYEKGRFGNFVYGEAQYHHDLSHFPQRFRDDRPASAVPPFLYPTHSTAMLLHAVNDHVVKVSAVGYRDVEPDTPYKKGENPWDNEFSDEFSLMQLSKGGTIRINECRRIGYKAPSSYVSSFYGTKGAYQFSNAQHIVTNLCPGGVTLEDVSDEVNPRAMTEHKGDADFKEKVANHAWQGNDQSPMQDETVAARSHLTPEYMAVKSNHMNSHRLLIDDFCTAVYKNTLPPVNAWVAARFTIPGLVAHQSAMQGGVLLDVPDCGDAPEVWG